MKYVYRLLAVIFLGIFLFSGWKVITLGMEYLNSRKKYSQLEQYVSLQTLPPQTEGTEGTEPSDAPTQMPGETAPTAPQTQPTEEQILWPVVDFEALAQINPDIVGWIYIPDTKINYPIVARDNAFYLDHLFTGEYNPGGCIFLDERCDGDFSDSHSILYGHHMKDGSMFASIREYTDQAYFDAHPMAMLVTPQGNFEVHFFSGYVADTQESAWQLEFAQGEFYEWVDEITRKSYFRGTVTPTGEDRVLTLSTCSYEFDNARFVLHGLIREAAE